MAGAKFAPLAPKLEGRLRSRGRHLTIVDGRGRLVMAADLSAWKRSKRADAWNERGAWRVYEGREGRFDRGLAGRKLSVIDAAGRVAATMEGPDLQLADGEKLSWAGPGFFNRACGFVGELWVAKKRWGRRRFRAELSTAMLAREDVGLLAAVGAFLTTRLLLMGTTGGGVGAIGDFGLGDGGG